jgi:catechol 2,3-dioxygenase-like lactoylglutathione lyase family enzyme
MAPVLDRIDHVHVFVADRAAAEAWYERVLGLGRLPELAHWAGGGGPLTLGNPAGSIHLALFEGAGPGAGRDGAAGPSRSTIALGVDGAAFREWHAHLAAELGRRVDVVDHGEACSLYFADPDGNPYEITSSDLEARASLPS